MDHPPDAQRDRGLLVLRLAALAGLAIAGYLLYLALTGRAAAGCGEDAGGCGDVLASRWSSVLGVPVAACAVGAYLVVLAVSIHAGPRSPQRHRDGAWRILGLLGVAAGSSALWFIALQVFVLRGFCGYCMAAHACSLVIAGVVLARPIGATRWIGLVPAGLVIGLQLTVTPPPPAPADRAVRFSNIEPDGAPVLGDPDAPHVIALLFDYNCGFCREAHAQVVAAVRRYDGQLAAVMLPTAIDPACNRGAESRGAHSGTSCELAKTALAVWIADPAQFAAYDRWLLDHVEQRLGDDPADVAAQADAEARRRVGGDALDAALSDPRLAQRLHIAGGVYEQATIHGHRGVPRLIVAGYAYPGTTEPQQLFDLLEQAYPALTPTPADDR